MSANQSKSIESILISLGFNTRSNNLPNLDLPSVLPGNEIGVSAYNDFLLEYSASGYDADREPKKRLDIFLYGLAEEWGVFQGVMKRINRGDREFDSSLDCLRLELGDFLAYLVLLASTVRISGEIVRLANLIDVLAHLIDEDKGLMSEFADMMAFPLPRQISLMSRKITRIIGTINELYEAMESSVSSPDDLDIQENFNFLTANYLSELLLHVSVLATMLSCNLGYVAFVNYRKLYDRQQKGTQYGSGSNR